MGPAAVTPLGILTGLIVFLAMALLGAIAAQGPVDAGVAPAQAESAAAGGSGDALDANGDGFLSLAEAADNEHIVTRSPGVHENWPHLFDRDGILRIAEAKMTELHGRGIRAIVDLTTVDLGRDIGLIVDVARRPRR